MEIKDNKNSLALIATLFLEMKGTAIATLAIYIHVL